MKKMSKLMILLAAGSFLFGTLLASCSSDGDSNGSPSLPYELTKENNEVTVNVGESIEVYVAGKTNIDPFEYDGLTIESQSIKGVFKITASNTALDGQILVNFNDGTEIDDGVDVIVYVYNPIFALTLTLDDALAAKASKIVVKYGNEQDNKFEEVEAVYTATEQTAVALLKKELANSDTWFNKTVVTVYDASDNVVSSELNVAYFCYTDKEFTGLSLTAALEEKTFTLRFDGFEIPGGKVEGVLVSNKWDTWEGEDVVFAPEVTVAEDGKSASFAVPFEKLTSAADFYVKAADIVIKNSSDEVQEISALSSSDSDYWYSYADISKMWITLAYVALTDADYTETAAVTGSIVTTAPAILVEASDLTGAKAIKVVYTEGTDDIVGEGTWITLYSSAGWGNETKLVNAWDSTVSVYDETAKTYTLYITAKDVVNAMVTNGIYVCADSSAYTGKITVSFVPGTN